MRNIDIIIILISLIVIIYTYYSYKKKLKQTREAYIKICENIVIQDKYAFISKLKDLCLKEGWKITQPNSDQIIIKTKWSFLSVGEIIKVNIQNNRVVLESSPVLKTTKIDYGKNKNNILKIKTLES